ncbi:hypothetical protein H0H93_008542 [Arthromyces matolae]|nr:hypothetical protein H0H93_008542 [Arthromyces matolae]
MKLEDQFEWDIENEQITPEDFAEVYVQDLGLNGEFKTAISHSIREQIQTYQKSLFLVGHPNDGSAIQDEDLRMAFLPSLISAARPSDQVSSFTPLLNYLSDGELDRNEKEREKDMNKRRKRNTRGRRGIALPDREPIRTYRTPAIGFPELDPATLALAAAANAPVSRRAAAAAASLTIANMVASENGTAFLPQVAVPASQVTAQQAQKDNSKKGSSAKGHFKAPSFPSEVLRPRANVAAPTPSTAADVSKLPAPLENDPPPPALASVVATIGTAGSLDGRGGPRVISARRAKELEREAKEKEFADGQHPNMINGVWHCSNCGCPDNIAVGRRKGPLGDKSQCGICETTKLEQASPTKMPLGKDGKPITLSPTTTFRGVEPPQWLSAAKAVMMTKYPSDRFETILRKVNANSAPEWRIKCLDCPGKLYTPGPGETLANYEVHLKNRQHRQRVNDRLNNEAES